MSVNGITSSGTLYDSASYVKNSTPVAETEEATKKTSPIDGVAAVYESSDEAMKAAEEAREKYVPNPELVEKLKADADARIQQLQDIVNKLLTKQGNTYNVAEGLKSFYENLEVDPETKAQAQKDIAEDGYWGVQQTSERIFDFAKALTGGDPEKMEEMREAFEKGFKQATKAWGDELPDICKQTKEAVNKLFDDYAASTKTSASAETQA